MDKYTADFETTTDENDCRVWAWGICNISNPNEFHYGNSIDGFIDYITGFNSTTFYFHNLKFDGEFIISWLMSNDWKWSNQRRLKNKEFKTLISDMGQFYSITVKLSENTEIQFLDSLKILPFSVDKIAKDFKLPINKLKIDYHKTRKIGHQLTREEVEYLKHDCKIIAMALYHTFEQGNTKMTAGANALHAYKNYVNNWKEIFPILSKSTHNDILLAYKGGFTYCHKKDEVGKGIVLDVNSLYPYVMRTRIFPYGKPIYFEGEYKKNELYPLYIQQIRCQFELKEGYIPTIQLKNNLSFIPVEYLKSSNDELVVITLTNIDLKIFLEHYDVYNLDYLQGYMFKGMNGMFNDYIDYYMSIKENSTGALRVLAKLMMNSLYGKFATGIDVTGKHPVIDENTGIVGYVKNEKEEREPIYLPVGVFCTAYAREVTINAAQKCYDRFIYADTDSLHLLGSKIPEGLEIHDTKLGAWKIENKFDKARFIKPKTYMEVKEKQTLNYLTDDIKINKYALSHRAKQFNKITDYQIIKCCGMPDNIKEKEVTWENFKVGFKSNHKLMPKHVKGGIVLVNGVFEIR